MTTDFTVDVAIVGGCGHVGLPLGLAFADAGLTVLLYDIKRAVVDQVTNGTMPFGEPGAGELLARVVGHGLTATSDSTLLRNAENIVIVIGTPVDEHLNPNPMVVSVAVEELRGSLVDGQIVILRSTVYPGTTSVVRRVIERLGVDVDVAFCPERIAEGKALVELHELPQIVASSSERGYERAERLFRKLTQQTIRLSPEEAELAKLFTNTWRYIKFATANQLFMIANDFGLDYEKVRAAIAHDYPRAADLPRAGFAAGPCLLKDTMQLAAFNNNDFILGHAAMMVNEGLPLYVVSRIEAKWDLSEMSVGILGMAFKGASDDIRSSLSYKLKRILRFKAKSVLCTDSYVTADEQLLPLDEVVAKADLLIIGAAHPEYRGMRVDVPVVDIWGMDGQGIIL
jgi:UDP-N-acetyl-D-mannosaminuronic acid dehydrogenase